MSAQTDSTSSVAECRLNANGKHHYTLVLSHHSLHTLIYRVRTPLPNASIYSHIVWILQNKDMHTIGLLLLYCKNKTQTLPKTKVSKTHTHRRTRDPDLQSQ